MDMENPTRTPDEQAKNAQTKKPWYKKWWVIGIGLLFFYSIINDSFDEAQEKAKNEKSTASNQQVAQQGDQLNEQSQQEVKKETTNKTDQQILEENLTGIIKKTSTTKLEYAGLSVEKSDSDRPKDSKAITVKLNVKDFYSKNSLMRETGEISANVFQAVYGTQSLKPYDVFVWYYSETADQYGNKKNSVILTYHIDKVTSEKINWQNFNKGGLCDFLEQEAKSTGTFNTGCKVLADIK